jgi:hypothetical protein
MSALLPRRLSRTLFQVLAACGFVLPSIHNLKAAEFEAVSGRISRDYIRKKLPDGTFAPESYAFGKGGYWGGPLNDKTIDKMDFMDVARVIAVPLAAQHYIPASDPKTTKLLIMVYWGTTNAPEKASESAAYDHMSVVQQELDRVWKSHTAIPPMGSEADALFEELSTAVAAVQAENRMRDNVDRRNAMMLGYDSWWEAAFDAQNGTPLEGSKKDMLNELEEYRYFVVLMAYDFQLLLTQKKHKLVWETRFSIRQHVNEFDKQLPAMALQASKYFGKDSNGLTHDLLPEGKVELGDIKSLGVVPEK